MQARGDRCTQSGTEASVRPWIQPSARAFGLDELTRERHEVAAVTDHDRVVGQSWDQLTIDASRVNGIRCRGEKIGISRRRCGNLLLQRRDPRVPIWFSPCLFDRFTQSVEYERQVSRCRAGEGGMTAELTRRIGQMHDTSGRRTVLAAERSVAEPEVEQRAHHDDQVGSAERSPTSLADEQWMPTGHDAPAHPVGDRGHAKALDEAQGRFLRAVGPHIGSENKDGSEGFADNRRDGVERISIGCDRSSGAHHWMRRCCGAEELIHRHVDEHRAAMGCAGRFEGLV